MCGLHVFDPETQTYNEMAVRDTLEDMDVVLIEWAQRDQGLVVAAKNPKRIAKLNDLRDKNVRFVDRQEGAGAKLLLSHLLSKEGLSISDLNVPLPPALNETDVGVTVSEGKADAGFAIRAVAAQFHLDFVPLHRERYDLAVRRREYFEPNFQRFLAFIRTPRFADKAAALGGYDIGGLGRVVYNSP